MKYDAIVVGGGLIGLGIGWRATQMGMAVLVLDLYNPPDGASWVAAGMLAPATETTFGEDELLQLNLQSARRWPEFAAELSAVSKIDLTDHARGILNVALDRDQSEALRRLYEHQQSLGLQVDWLTSSACRRLEPGLHPSTQSGVMARQDWAVDPRKVIQALRTAINGGGGDVRYGTKVAEIVSGTSPGVILMNGRRLQAHMIVLAAGSWSGTLAGIPELLKKCLRPVKGQILRLATRDRQPPPAQRTIRTEDVYIVPRPDGEVVLGATVEEMGFDRAPTAGGVLDLLRCGEELLPGLRELELVEARAGIRPATPDNGPVIDQVAPGLIVATGHYRNGVLLTPVTGEGVASMLSSGKVIPELAPFVLARFLK